MERLADISSFESLMNVSWKRKPKSEELLSVPISKEDRKSTKDDMAVFDKLQSYEKDVSKSVSDTLRKLRQEDLFGIAESSITNVISWCEFLRTFERANTLASSGDYSQYDSLLARCTDLKTQITGFNEILRKRPDLVQSVLRKYR